MCGGGEGGDVQVNLVFASYMYVRESQVPKCPKTFVHVYVRESQVPKCPKTFVHVWGT